MSKTYPDSPGGNIEGVINATTGPSRPPVQPEGGSNVTPQQDSVPVSPREVPEDAPATVSPAQGAGSGAGGLYPNPGEVADGSVNVGGNLPDSSTGPRQLSVVPGLASLTAGGNFGANRPSSDGADPGAAPVGRDDTALGRDQSLGQGVNPALTPMQKPARAPRWAGLFGKPSA